MGAEVYDRIRQGAKAFLVVGTLILALLVAGHASAETRRAFVMSAQRYTDHEIPSLGRSNNDASDLAGDLEQLGFDKKNITLAVDIHAKADFDKRFAAFLATVQEGDVVLFFYSGHGLGVEANDNDYLLLGDIKSLYAFTRDQMIEADRRREEIIRLKMTSFEGRYETDEIEKNGVSVADTMDAIGKKKPKVAVFMLDACRSLVRSTTDVHEVDRGPATGSRLLPATGLFPGAIVIFSASFGESAIEGFGDEDTRRNSLFTEVVRSELQRPGQTLVGLAERVRRMVSAYALSGGLQQEPEYFENLGLNDNFLFIDSIGGERFRTDLSECDGSDKDWAEISLQPSRKQLEKHARRFRHCPTGELARESLARLIVSSTVTTPAVTTSKTIDDCDRLAASDTDFSRPAEAPGVPLEKIDADAAIAACNAAIEHNPRITRYTFNLGRAKYTYAQAMRADDVRRKPAMIEARAAFDDAAKSGYVPAIFNLATLFSTPDDSAEEQQRANDLLKKAADQEYPPAMFEMGARNRDGSYGFELNDKEAHRWMAKAADSGSTAAMVEVAEDLFYGRGVKQNPRQAVQLARRAADAGSDAAKFKLGWYYFRGKNITSENAIEPISVARDYTEALLWFGRAAQNNIAAAQYNLGYMMERGLGLSSPQPEIAERYYRLAASGGDEDAEIDLAKRLRAGRMLSKPENGANEALDLLTRALSHGSARAAEILAEVYRNGELGRQKDPVAAMKYAYRAIDLSVQANPTEEDGNPFWEIDAGILLAEMAVTGQAVDVNGRPLLNPDEIDRLQKYYGTVDKDSRRVKTRVLNVPLDCGGYPYYKPIWVWDWGRSEAPTEPQFRSLERQTQCYNNGPLRATLAASFAAAKKAGVPFADLIAQQILSAQAQQTTTKKRK